MHVSVGILYASGTIFKNTYMIHAYTYLFCYLSVSDNYL